MLAACLIMSSAYEFEAPNLNKPLSNDHHIASFLKISLISRIIGILLPKTNKNKGRQLAIEKLLKFIRSYLAILYFPGTN